MKATKVLSTTFTYTLGKSLYIPLTSRCNSKTLPQTRGPNFVLPNSVVTSLLNVRKAEMECTDSFDYVTDDADGKRSILPSPIFPKVYLPTNYKYKYNMKYDFRENSEIMDLNDFYPTAEKLVEEIQEYMRMDDNSNDKSDAIQPPMIVFAGEGEPTLRLGAILHIAQVIQTIHKHSRNNSVDSVSPPYTPLPLRLVTNGLVLSLMTNPDRQRALHDLKEVGVNELSIALMTSCSIQYNQLMQPTIQNQRIDDEEVIIHDELCLMIKEAIDIGMDVELTGVDHSFVDKTRVNDLAGMLGVTNPFRWRPFFP